MGTIQNKTSPERGSFFEKEGAKRPCWSCEHDGDDLYNCSNCDRIQQFFKESDYFTWFGFGHFLSIDQDALEKQYYTLSRKFHPDYFQQRTPKEQAISLENTAMLTQAYRILKDPKKRAAYLIGLIEGDHALRPEAPAALFEEIFEIQERLEALEEAASEDAGAKRAALLEDLKNDLQKMQTYREEADRELQKHFLEWDRLEKNREAAALSGEQKTKLDQMKTLLSHEGYLERIILNIQTVTEKKQ